MSMPRRNKNRNMEHKVPTKRCDLSKSWTNALLKDLKKKSKKKKYRK